MGNVCIGGAFEVSTTGIQVLMADHVTYSQSNCSNPVADLGLEERAGQIFKTVPTSGCELRLFCTSEHLFCNVYVKVQCVGHILASGECGTIPSYDCAN